MKKIVLSLFLLSCGSSMAIEPVWMIVVSAVGGGVCGCVVGKCVKRLQAEQAPAIRLQVSPVPMQTVSVRPVAQQQNVVLAAPPLPPSKDDLAIVPGTVPGR